MRQNCTTVGVESVLLRDPDYGRSRDSRLTGPARNKQHEPRHKSFFQRGNAGRVVFFGGVTLL